MVAAFAVAALAGTAAAAPLTPAEERGRQIYRDGRSPSGGTIRAFVGGTPLPGEAVPCAGCHGEDGRGKPEGGVAPPEITWETLTRPYGHVHPDGRRHPAFDEPAAMRAIAEGIDPAGNPLSPAMPRFSMPRSDLRDLVAYLHRVGAEQAPGVTTDAIRIGTVLPMSGRKAAPSGDTSGPLATLGAEVRALLEAEFAEINRAGGIHGRRLELSVAAFDGPPATGPGRFAELHAGAPVFAAIAGVFPGAEEELAAWVDRNELPWIGPLTHLELTAGGAWVFRPAAGLTEEARVLVRHVASGLDLERPECHRTKDLDARIALAHRTGIGPWRRLEHAGNPVRGAVIYPREPGHVAAARAAIAEAERMGLILDSQVYERGRFNAGLAERLRNRGVRFVVFLGGDTELASFAARAHRGGYTPELLVPGTGAARAALAVPASFTGKVRLAYPTLPSVERPDALDALGRKSPGFRAGRFHTALISVHASAAVLAEGLRCAGRQLDRGRFVACLERLGGLETGLLPPIGFGTGRRVGSAGGYVVAPDSEGKSFQLLGGFVRLDTDPAVP